MTEDEGVALDIIAVTNLFDTFNIEYTRHTNVDKAGLENTLKEVSDIKLSDYTQKTASKLKTSIEKGKEYIESEDKTQKEIDAVTDEIKSNKNSLIKDEHIKMYIIIGLLVVNVILAIVVFVITRKKKINKKIKQDERSARLKKIDDDLRKDEIKEDGIFELNDWNKEVFKEDKSSYTTVLEQDSIS